MPVGQASVSPADYGFQNESDTRQDARCTHRQDVCATEFMKSPLEAPEKQIAEETSAKVEKPAPAVIDTSKMAKGQREALELAEAARDPLEDRGRFASNLVVGRYDFDRIYPYPAQSAEDRVAGEDFLRKLESYLREHVDPDEIDPTGEIPPENFKAVGESVARGIRVSYRTRWHGLSPARMGTA